MGKAALRSPSAIPNRIIMRVSGDYDKNGHALVEELVPAEVCNAFLNQLKADVERAGGALDRMTRPSNLLRRDAPELYGYHYPPMLALLWGLTPTVAGLTGRDLLPTYSYFRLYREGDICRVHSDRYSCEHSMSLTLDYSDGVPWPLEIATAPSEPSARVEEDFGSEGHRSVVMRPGDALLYDGVHRRHGRVAPNPNAWSAHLFLHWVERGGPYAEHAFDRNAETARPVNFSFR
jgi:hypothetical protein